jgi:hypothetical protein
VPGNFPGKGRIFIAKNKYKIFIFGDIFRGRWGVMWRRERRAPDGRSVRGTLEGHVEAKGKPAAILMLRYLIDRDEGEGGIEGREHRWREEAETDQRRQHGHHLPSSSCIRVHRRLVVSHWRPYGAVTSPRPILLADRSSARVAAAV